MPLPRYVERRHRKFYARLRIPNDVRGHYQGKLRLLQSLGTDNIREAEHRALVLVAKWKREFDQVRRAAGAAASLDPFQSEAKEWLAAIRDAPDEEAEDQVRSLLQERVDDLAFKRSRELGVNPGAFERENPGADKYDLPGYEDERIQTFLQTATGRRVELLDHLDQYLEAPTTDMKAKSKAQVRADLQRLAREVPLLRDVDRKAVQGWVERLLFEAGLSIATIRRTLSSCRTYWRYLQHQGIVPSELANPFMEIDFGSRKGRRNANGPRRGERALEATEVVRLLRAAEERGDHQLTDLISLAMWTGCRREELCMLKVEQVKLDAPIPYFEVEEAKTEAGWRQVPIHSQLMPAMERLLKETGDGFVLSGLAASNMYGIRGDAVGKRFSHLKSRLGFDKRYVFHSIRKTVITLLDNAEVPVVVIAELVGHERPTFTQKTYFGGATLERKKGAIERLAYPDLDPSGPQSKDAP